MWYVWISYLIYILSKKLHMFICFLFFKHNTQMFLLSDTYPVHVRSFWLNVILRQLRWDVFRAVFLRICTQTKLNETLWQGQQYDWSVSCQTDTYAVDLKARQSHINLCYTTLGTRVILQNSLIEGTTMRLGVCQHEFTSDQYRLKLSSVLGA